MSDPTSRALTLLGVLQSRAFWPGRELAARLGVTDRTLRRDIERIRSLGYTVNADAGPGGGYTLGRGEVLPPLLLDEEQAVATTMALARAAQDSTAPGAHAALRALATIDEVIPAHLRQRLLALRDATTLAPTAPRDAPDAPVAAETLMACADAIRRQVRLTFTYRDRHSTTSTRRVEPHRLVAGYVWRLVAYDLDRTDWRTFRLDRMTGPEVGTWRFVPRPDLQDALDRLNQPTPPEAWRHHVTAVIHAPLDAVAASMPRSAGILSARGPATTDFRSGADNPDDAAWWLARLGHDFTVTGDTAVVEAVRRLATRCGNAVASAEGQS